MKRNLLHIAYLAFLVPALAACTKEPAVQENDGTKSPIELSVGIEGVMDEPATKATVVTEKTASKTFADFKVASKVFMVMKSEWVTLPSGYTDFNYQGAHDTKYCVTRGEVAANQSKMTFDNGNERYWDDAHARSSRLSIWAYTAPGAPFNDCQFGTSDGIQTWKTTAISPVINRWRVSAYTDNNRQDETQFIRQNLCFSNNLVDYSAESGSDNRLYFKTPDKKFQGGEMVFYHAMSKITIHIKKGVGYTPSETLTFASGTNVKLHSYNVEGAFDIADGQFTSTVAGDMAWIYNHTAPDTGDTFTLEALVVPGTTHSTGNGSIWNKDNTGTSMSFTINDNLYLISQDALITALRNHDGNGVASDAATVELEAGKNYIFTFVVGKKQIDDITAVVADWETVTAEEMHPSNARIQLSVEDRTTNTGPVISDMDIYRALDMADAVRDDYVGYNWTTGYTTDGKAKWNQATLAYNTNKWSTDWFWESNKHYYHFRTLSPITQTVTQDAGGDYTTITSASCADEASYNQMAWGAPFHDVADDYKFTYSTTKGFDGTGAEAATPTHQIYKAIGPTENPVKVLMFHMMSGVHFTIKTDAGSDAKVELYDGSQRTLAGLESYYPDGKVLMGTGLVNAVGTKSTASNLYNVDFASAADGTHYANQEYYFSAVPQSLAAVKLYITTPDHNQYIVDLKDVKAAPANVSSKNIKNPYNQTDGKYVIDYWYPGFNYNYTFKLSKKKIEDISVTVLNWETVEAAEEEVQIK